VSTGIFSWICKTVPWRVRAIGAALDFSSGSKVLDRAAIIRDLGYVVDVGAIFHQPVSAERTIEGLSVP
jgi:hypothetical protein